MSWSAKVGIKAPKLRLDYFSDANRGVSAKANIRAGDDVIFVPRNQLISFDIVSDTPIGKIMLEKDFINRYGEEYFFYTYIMSERKKDPELR